MFKWLSKIFRPIKKSSPKEIDQTRSVKPKTDDLETDLDRAKSELHWFFKNKNVKEKKVERLDFSETFQSLFPTLFKLVRKSRITELEIEGKTFRMYAWDTKEGHTCGWICAMEFNPKSNIELIDAHQELLINIGGIQERWDEFDELENYEDYTLNQYFLFTQSSCVKGIGVHEMSYLQRCEKKGIPPLEGFRELLCFVREANGNSTLYDSKTKEVFLYASDHNFNYVKPLDNQPEYSFYRIRGVKSFEDYVEKIGSEWLKAIK